MTQTLFVIAEQVSIQLLLLSSGGITFEDSMVDIGVNESPCASVLRNEPVWPVRFFGYARLKYTHFRTGHL